MWVEIYRQEYGETVLAGTLTYDGRQVTAQPPDSPSLRKVLERPVYDTEAGKPVSAQDDPERFLKALPDAYRSYYFWASDVIEGDGDEGEDGPPEEVTAPLLFPQAGSDGPLEG